MRKNSFLEAGFIVLLYFTYFYISFGVFDLPPFPVIVLFGLILLIYQKPVRSLARRILRANIYRSLSDALQILHDLNMYLNQTIRYQEVRQALLSSFNRLFTNHPWAFYILQNDTYHLVPFEEKENIDNFPQNLSLLSFQKAQTNILTYSLQDSGIIEEAIQTQFLQMNINTLFLFPGHNRIAALLVLNSDGCVLFRNAETRALFEKIQKKAGLILENAALFADLEQRNREIHQLFEVNEKILSSFDPKQTLDFILASLKSLINYDAAAVFLIDKTGENLLSASSDGYPQKALKKLHLKIGQGACGWVVQSGQINLLDDVNESEHYYPIRPQTKSQLSVPLLFNGNVLGVICLESDKPRFFKQATVETLKLFATQAAIAIHNAQQIDIYLAKKALEHELVDAGAVQRRLLVQRIPRIDNLQISVSHQAS
ncbi:MAG TPA: GAF domain-containing protein, partial [Calditrichaeota bacterium]|nr:GAF domain-containing protein [Calditrichota bacterium]